MGHSRPSTRSRPQGSPLSNELVIDMTHTQTAPTTVLETTQPGAQETSYHAEDLGGSSAQLQQELTDEGNGGVSLGDMGSDKENS